MYDLPNYSGYNIPTMEGLLGFLSQEDRDRLGMSGSEIAQSFGYSGSKYGDYFNPVDLSEVQSGLADLPELQGFLRNNARGSYLANREGLYNKIGSTGLAGTGSFKNKYSALNTRFANDMFSADKQVQNIVEEYKGKIGEGVNSWQRSLLSLAQMGADRFSVGENNPYIPVEDNPVFSRDSFYQDMPGYEWDDNLGRWVFVGTGSGSEGTGGG